LPLRGPPVLHRLHQVINAVVLAEPGALAFVAIEHPRLLRDDASDVDAERRDDRVPKGILPFERVAVKEMGDVIERRMDVATVQEIGNGRGERGGTDDLAGL